MRVSKLKLEPDKKEALLVLRAQVQAQGCQPVLDRVANHLREQICSLGLLLNSKQLLEARDVTYTQIKLVHWLCLFLDQEASVGLSDPCSWMDYCHSLYMGLLLKMARKLQLVQNTAAHLLYDMARDIPPPSSGNCIART